MRFIGDSLPFGITNLYVTFEYKSYFKIILTKLMVMNILSIYNVKPTHTKQIEGDVVDLSYGDKVFDKSRYQRTKKQPKRVMLVLPNDNLFIKESPT